MNGLREFIVVSKAWRASLTTTNKKLSCHDSTSGYYNTWCGNKLLNFYREGWRATLCCKQRWGQEAGKNLNQTNFSLGPDYLFKNFQPAKSEVSQITKYFIDNRTLIMFRFNYIMYLVSSSGFSWYHDISFYFDSSITGQDSSYSSLTKLGHVCWKMCVLYYRCSIALVNAAFRF